MAECAEQVRLGLVIPSVNTVIEPWLADVLPGGVSAHVARMLMPRGLTPEAVVAMDRDQGMMAVRQIASCRPAVIAYGCTVSSVIQGLDYDAHLRGEIAHEGGVPATTSSHAILSALAALEARRISIVSPYTQEIDALEHRYFAAAGLAIEGHAHLGIGDTFALSAPDARDLTELARRGWSPASDALVITCLNTRSHLVVEALEREFGKPVITSTTATLWHALRLAGVGAAIAGGGRLFRDH